MATRGPRPDHGPLVISVLTLSLVVASFESLESKAGSTATTAALEGFFLTEVGFDEDAAAAAAAAGVMAVPSSLSSLSKCDELPSEEAAAAGVPASTAAVSFRLGPFMTLEADALRLLELVFVDVESSIPDLDLLRDGVLRGGHFSS